MPEVADKIASIKDPFVQAKIATELFGGAGADLLPFLRKGAAGIREYQQEAAKYNPVTQQSIAAANQFREAQSRLTMSVEGLANRISTQLGPVIAPMLTQLANWIATSPQVQSGIDALSQGVKQLAGYLSGVDWGAVGRGLLSWGQAIGGTISALGGLHTIVIAVAGFMAVKWVGSTLLFGASLVRLGLTVARVGAMFLPLLLSPIGLAVAGGVVAVAALGAAGYELWKHWDAVSRFFAGMWDGIRSGFSSAWKFISPILDRLRGGIDAIANSWLGRKLGTDRRYGR